MQDYTTPQLFKIDQEVLEADFERLGTYDTDDLELLKKLWLDKSLSDNPTQRLLALEIRPDIAEESEAHASIRRPYRAGVLIGTIVMRHRMSHLGIPHSIVDLARHQKATSTFHTLSHELLPVEPTDIRLSRFALNQFFNREVDIAQHLKNTLEEDWLHRHNSFAPTNTHDTPHNDWLAVGMGDTLATYGLLYAKHAGVTQQPVYKLKYLEDEPDINLTRSTVAP